MFKNLSTSTKLIILCGMFILSIGVTTHSLVAEHRIAIDFARRELLGNRYLAILRNVYAAILSERPIDSTTASSGGGTGEGAERSCRRAGACRR